ncbi:hypothetical protein [Bacillus alkalicellulosilyticus]|uniref:hypothetical protein n=1 Tax=Alkalihalobacterium alkalicellulosilyticum TaxID=1912214 RepID=UPI000995F9A4|nr:hypothetical protein [Bacillus alkalicellulosilyticus]
MYKEMSLHECILDALSDDDESIIQIEGYFKHTTYKSNRNDIKTILIDLLKNDLINISYPAEKSKEDFIKSNSHTIEDFWFGRTEKGTEVWNKIEF